MAGRRGDIRFLGVSLMFTLAAFLAVAWAGDDKSLPSAGGSPIVLAKAITLPEGAKRSVVPLSGRDRIAEQLSGLQGLNNVGWVAPGIVRGARPDADGFDTLKKMGVRTVIDLRTELDERPKVESAGMHFVHIPMTEGEVNPAAIRKALAVLADPGCQPVYIHCTRGTRRTGTVVAAYRMELQGWSLKDAKSEMQLFGVGNIVGQIKDFLDGYAKWEGEPE